MGKRTTKGRTSIDVRQMHIPPGAKGVRVSTGLGNGELVRISWTPCNYGGQRAWWICPRCGQRVAVLYHLGAFACRHCHQLVHQSTRTAPSSKPFERANKIRKRLGWGGGVAHPLGEKPKGMHWETYGRLLQQLNVHSIAAMQSTDRMVGRLRGKLDGIALGLKQRDATCAVRNN